MFSDSRTTTPGEQKSFKPHTPHFIPWLRNSLKAQHGGGDLGVNGPYKSSSEARNNLTPLERAKGIGFFSIQGKERGKKGELRCNGIGMLPVMLRGHHILPGSLGKQKDGGSARWNKTKELDTDTPRSEEGLGDSSSSTPKNHSFVKNHGSSLGLHQPQKDGTSVKKYGPLVGPPPTPVPMLVAEKPQVPVVVCVEDGEGKVWDYSSRTTYRQRDLHSSSWLSSDTQRLIERQQGFSSSFSYINKHSRNSQSHRDLGETTVEALNGPLNGLIFSTEIPHRGLPCTTTLRGPRKPRPNSERITTLGQNQTWVQHKPNAKEESPQRKEAGCTTRVVRNQIKRVMDNLEQVLTALRDIQQEMKEVVQQIDYLTSSIDLDEEEQQGTRGDAKPPSDTSYSSGSSSSEIVVGSLRQRQPEADMQPGAVDLCGPPIRDHHSRSQSPQNARLSSITSGFLSDGSRSLRKTCCPSRRKSDQQPKIHTLSPQRSLPARPPTPGLSPLTVNLHHPSSPASQPHSPGASSSIRTGTISPPSPLFLKPYPPPALSPSVIIETKVRANKTTQSNVPSAGLLSPSRTPSQSKSCPPTHSVTQASALDSRERRASSAGPSRVCTASAGTAKPPTAQGRRSRKPPPYPQDRLSEPTKKVKEPRKAPPYPEKRKLLSTTV
uniref:Proline rich 16 n=1 Tax=Nothobranchius kadleci TaxID=1051664 RepID=A0A1A8C188_NOTKA